MLPPLKRIDRMNVKLELRVGIIEGDLKRFLEGFNTGLCFSQRKAFDEYYSKTQNEVDISLEELSLISERLTVEVQSDEIIITDR